MPLTFAQDGTMKHVFKRSVRSLVPDVIAERKDKMGFPVPLTDWMHGPARDFVTVSQQPIGEVGADKPAPARDQNLHPSFLSW